MRIVHAVGARPNFVKMGPVIEALAGFDDLEQLVVHTGQHYDRQLSDDILRDLSFPEPDIFLGVGSGSHAEQTGRTLIAFEDVLEDVRPDLVVVAGDVNATLACALAAAKLGIDIAHVESGLRSDDWTMPEEINRVLTDRLSRLLFTHSPEACDNLLREGVERARIHFVGNTMIDSLLRLEPEARERAAWLDYGLGEGDYVLVTLHRPSNVDEPARLAAVVDALEELGRRVQVVFPLHPRTRRRLLTSGDHDRLAANVLCLEPLGYTTFLSLATAARAIVTDSGGVQEEATALGVPCHTLRRNTERPITITEGTNRLLGDDPRSIVDLELPRPETVRRLPALWDGQAGLRVARTIVDVYRPTGYART